jgi:hypothetical protein
MPLLERFAFHGTAAALSGRVIRPAPTVIDVGAASALPVAGGISRSRVAAADFAGVIGFDSAETHAQGEAREAPVLRGPRRKPPESTEAHTGAEVRGFSAGGAVRMTVRRIRAELTAVCALAEHQPSIGAMDGASFAGVAFGRYRLSVVIDRRFFRDHDTHDKVCSACAQPRGRSKSLPRAVLSAPPAGDPGAISTTIVKGLRWLDRPHPRSRIDGHVLTIQGFGKVHFGEMVVSGHTRRLTMLRLELDGDVVLDAACCEVEAGGAWCR